MSDKTRLGTGGGVRMETSRRAALRFALVIGGGLLATVVAGCGKKANLKAPEGSEDRYPRKFPKGAE